jgi:hypothetical protein
MLTHPDASKAVFFAATPSDYRWWLNTLAIMRRVLPPVPKPGAPSRASGQTQTTASASAGTGALLAGRAYSHVQTARARTPSHAAARPRRRRIAGGPAG